jgi:hypothetical protein
MREVKMKILFICLSMVITSSLLYSQSTIVYDAGTGIDVGTGADVCADVITINGIFTGNGTFCTAPVAVEVDTSLVPNKFELSQNYPNPFNPSTRIKYQVAINSQVSLKVFDVLGNEVATLVNEEKPAGNYEVEFNASQLSSGVYFYKLQAAPFLETRKMILIR